MAQKTMSPGDKSAALAVKAPRTAARKAKNVAANVAQHKANSARVKELGLTLRMVDDRRKPRHPNRMTPSKALRLFDRERMRAA